MLKIKLQYNTDSNTDFGIADVGIGLEVKETTEEVF